jgi:ParB family chromosome partitioning protein
MSKAKASGGLGKGLSDMSHFQDHSAVNEGVTNPLFRKVETPVVSIHKNSPRIVARMAGDIAMIPIGDIEPNREQPRTEFDKEALKCLASSIRELGIIQPITVRKTRALKYQIISGERRFRASQQAGLDEIPAYIRVADDRQLLEMALVENVQREDLHPIEIATSYQRLIDECKLSHDGISRLVGKARASVSNQLRLLDLPEEVKIELARKALSQGHAKALLSISNNPERQILIMNIVITQKLSVRQTEELCKKDGGRKSLKRPATKVGLTLSPDEEQAISNLRLRYAGGVKIKKDGHKGGRLEFHFKDSQELEQLLEKLTRQLTR